MTNVDALEGGSFAPRRQKRHRKEKPNIKRQTGTETACMHAQARTQKFIRHTLCKTINRKNERSTTKPLLRGVME